MADKEKMLSKKDLFIIFELAIASAIIAALMFVPIRANKASSNVPRNVSEDFTHSSEMSLKEFCKTDAGVLLQERAR